MIKRYIEKIIEQYIDNNINKIREKLNIDKTLILDLSRTLSKEQDIKYKCDYYEKVNHKKRYFQHRVINGKINNEAPEEAKYVVSVTLEQPEGIKFVIDYDDIEKPVPEIARIYQEGAGFSINSLVTQSKHYVNFKKFFTYNVSKEIAIQSVLARIKKARR